MTIAVRPATEHDLPELVGFEITIAEESFGEDALTDPDRHRGRLAKALERDPDGCLVAVDTEADADPERPEGRAIGWLWMTINSNFLTEEAYASFRSLAVAEGPRSTEVARALVERGLQYAWDHDVTEVVGKVSAANLPMRMLYKEAGFEPRHLTMRLLGPGR